MIKKTLPLLYLLFFYLIACQEKIDTFESISTLTPTSTSTPTSIPTNTPSPTNTHIVLSRVIPDNYYNIVKIKYTFFKDGEATYICIFVNTHKFLRTISDTVIEVSASIESQKILEECPFVPQPKNFNINIFTGEIINETDFQESIVKNAYYGKNYKDVTSDTFSIPVVPISVWKITTPYLQKDMLGKLDVFMGTEERLIDKTTGILIYKKIEYYYIQDPTWTFLVEMISMNTNAPIGGLVDGTEFSYSKEE